MLSRDPTYLGTVTAVSGSSVSVQVAKSVSSGLSIIEGRAYRVGQVGSFVRIPQGYQELFGIVSDVGASATPVGVAVTSDDTGTWMKIQLIGESIGTSFGRGTSQYPSIGDSVHITTESGLTRIYGTEETGNIVIGSLSSAESIPAKLSLDELVTRHSAILGSTGSGKSTTVASLLQAIATQGSNKKKYPSARILMLDLHGEYPSALSNNAVVFTIDPQEKQEQPLFVPYWALSISDILGFLAGNLSEAQEAVFLDKIYDLKIESHREKEFSGVQEGSITVDTPLPFSLKKLWYDLIDFEVATFTDPNGESRARLDKGDPENLIVPKYQPHGMGSKGPFLNRNAAGVRRQLNLLRSRLLDRRYDFLLRPGPWEPDLDGKVKRDLDGLVCDWLGSSKPITILDLSGVPSAVLERLVGSILKVVYESLFWSREKSEGGIERPLLIVMEEAHRYLSGKQSGLALEVVQRIAKEGRKYGVGAMVVSQRPSEVDETILSQCGTFFALRLSNPGDRDRVKGTLPDALVTLLDVLPVLRTGEAIIMGESAKLPMRCRITLPQEDLRPRSTDPEVSEKWALPRRTEGYDRVVASWRAQSPRAVVHDPKIKRELLEDTDQEDPDR